MELNGMNQLTFDRENLASRQRWVPKLAYIISVSVSDKRMVPKLVYIISVSV